MNLQLIQGQFSNEEIFEIVNKMIDIKIKYHEKKISLADTEEDIKFREKKIKTLQQNLQEVRSFLKEKNNIFINGQLNFS